MPDFVYPFAYSEVDSSEVKGTLELEQPLPYQNKNGGSGFYRPGRISMEGWEDLELVFYHNNATSQFIYLRQSPVDQNLMSLAGLTPAELQGVQNLRLPGQLCLGADRSRLIGRAVQAIFAAPPLQETVAPYQQHNLAIFPIAREGLKYQIAEAIFDNFGFYCDEVILDAHHVFDSSVPVYNRKVEMTLFKDKDLDQQQKQNISVAFIADSIASGLVMREVIDRIKDRFDNIQRIEVIAPLATVRGLCRVARSHTAQKTRLRLHVFETLLNALAPDYYYSAHHADPRFHIRPDLEAEYRAWWGKDGQDHVIADTACAGYGWSEVFFSPRKQIQMMNSELRARHNIEISEIISRNLA